MARLGRSLLLCALVACSSASGDIGVAEGFSLASIPEGERTAAPPIEGEVLGDGEPVSADLIDGKVAVVNFWGSWCGPCYSEQPHLERAWRAYRDKGVQFVGVDSRRDQEAAALAFLERFDVTYPSIFDPTSRIAFEQGVLFMPATIVLDAQGRVAARLIGALSGDEELTSILDAELA